MTPGAWRAGLLVLATDVCLLPGCFKAASGRGSPRLHCVARLRLSMPHAALNLPGPLALLMCSFPAEFFNSRKLERQQEAALLQDSLGDLRSGVDKLGGRLSF